MMETIRDCDVLVIGSGAIGATYARCLAGMGRQVVMIDTGPQIRSRPGEHLLNTFRYQHEPNLSLDEGLANHNTYSTAQNYLPQMLPPGAYRPDLKRLNFENPNQDPKLNMPFAASMYAVGGMFSFWSGFAPIPTKADRTDLIPEDDWGPMIDMSIKLLNVHTDAFEPSIVNSCVREVLSTPERTVRNMPMGAQKRSVDAQVPGSGTYYVDWTGSDTILGPLLGDDNRTVSNLQILESHRAEEILHDGAHVTGVRVRNLRNLSTIEFRAAQFVVATNALPGASLLWASGVRPPALGRYLCDNPVATGNIHVGDAFVERLRGHPDNPSTGEAVPIPWTDPPPKTGLAPTADCPWLVHVSRTGRVMTYHTASDVRLSMDITGYTTVEARKENFVEFSDTMQDRFGMPQMTFHYSLTDADNARCQAMLQDVNELGKTIGVWGKMSRPPFESGATLQVPGTSLHITGVTRMGTDDTDSVVDSNSRVWGFDNLYVGGQGVLRESMAINPTFTCCAIAIKSAASMLGISVQELESKVAPTPETADPGMPLDWRRPDSGYA
ncbi:MAG: GMC oxidoreductase [Pseudomonadota bacterium]